MHARLPVDLIVLCKASHLLIMDSVHSMHRIHKIRWRHIRKNRGGLSEFGWHFSIINWGKIVLTDFCWSVSISTIFPPGKIVFGDLWIYVRNRVGIDLANPATRKCSAYVNLKWSRSLSTRNPSLLFCHPQFAPTAKNVIRGRRFFSSNSILFLAPQDLTTVFGTT